MKAAWRICLLGSLQAEGAQRTITRFRTRKTGALLGYLAYHRSRSHPRDALVELLWPEDDPDTGRHKLRNALSSLRRQLEPPGASAGAVIVSNRTDVQLNPAAVDTDVAAFERACAAAGRASSEIERALLREEAVGLYRGELLPGQYDDWIMPERQRLSDTFFRALQGLIRHLEQAGDTPRALGYARRAVSADLLREEAHRELMRLLARSGQPAAALQQYQELERLLRDELGAAPEAATQELARRLETDPGSLLDGPMVSGAPAPAPPADAPAAAHGDRAGLPVGTVTLLLAEFEDLDARAAWADGAAVLRREFRRHNGFELRETGGLFSVVFAGANRALECAVSAQQALGAHGWPEEVRPSRVRIALHTGDIEWDVEGCPDLVLYHASRMLLAAHPGQILCSEITAGLLRRNGAMQSEAAAPGARLLDLGLHRLRDMETPERLFQVSDPGLTPEEFPPLKAGPAFASNLPLQITRFFGRRHEIAHLKELLLPTEGERARLVTVTGPGGSGKTRLALAAAEQLVEPLRGAAWFVPLADLSDPALIPGAILEALELLRSPESTAMEQITDALAPVPALLLLDNFEHLVAEGAALVRTLLERAPALRCLVTSRQRLGLDGEREFPVPPLPIPPAPDAHRPDAGGRAGSRRGVPDLLAPEQLTLYESVQLFIDRAQAVRPDFQVTNATAAAVAALCQRLEGIPLALELAAARVRNMAPGQILAHLEHRLDFLSTQRRDATPRHQTLRAAIDWSYRLLAPELQRLFARLSVFRGGWTLEAASTVCEEPLALDRLTQLQECSLVLGEEGDLGVRFRMLETLREFAAEQLGGDERSLMEQRHAVYFLSLGEAIGPRLATEERREEIGEFQAELENFRLALEWGSGWDPLLALRLAVAMEPFWDVTGRYEEGGETLVHLMERAGDLPSELRLQGWQAAATLTQCRGEFANAGRLYEEALALSRELGDDQRTQSLLEGLSGVFFMSGDMKQAYQLAEERLNLCQDLGDELIADARTNVAFTLMGLGDLTQWVALLEDEVREHRRSGDQQGLSGALHLLGIAYSDYRQWARSRALFEESMAIQREFGKSVRFGQIHLAHVALAEGNPDEAQDLLIQSLTVCRQRGEKRLIVECLHGLGEVAVARAASERAARLLAAAKALQEAIGFAHWGEYDTHIAALREALGEAPFTAAWEAGRAMTWQQAVEYALRPSPD
jgi:predicted ATPase/DNA-binding SARP family transcriptional activator